MTTWVLLRGLTRETRHWGPLPQRLALRLGGAAVVALELPGNGARHRERSPDSVEQMVAACRQSLVDAGHEPPYVLMGLSLGAMVATAWTHSQPDELEGVVLINGSSRALSPWHRRLRWQSIPSVLRIFATRDAAARERLVLRLTARHPPLRYADLVADWAAWWREHPVEPRNALRQWLAAARFTGRSTRPPMPVLVLASEGDALVDPRCSKQLAKAWRAELRVHPTAGHDLPLDAPDWVVEQTARWWRARA